MDADDPVIAQKIVSEYAAMLEAHDREDLYPASLDTLPYPKETIKAAVHTSVRALRSTGQMNDELRDFLEVAYVSLADYVDGELVRLLADYRKAGATLATDQMPAREKVASPAWQVVAQTGRLAGEIAKAIADEADRLRDEFRRLLSQPLE